MKHVTLIVGTVALAALILLAAGCSLGNWMTDPAASGGGSSSLDLPRDTVDYTARSFEQFTTFYPVQLEITVELYEAGANGEARQLSPGAADVYLRLHDPDGSKIYEGRVGSDGFISTAIYLPSAPQDVELSLTAEGFENRSVTIADMVRYERIERTMAMAREAGFTASRSLEPDEDNDGVPDVYDADVTEPGTAFKTRYPAEGHLTVAYEDLYGRAEAGDADYNDFIAAYVIEERINDEGTALDSVRFDVTAQEKLAGYDHTFGIRIDSYKGTADVTGKLIYSSGLVRTYNRENLKAPLNVELFRSTATVIEASDEEKKTAWFEIDFDRPQNIDPTAGEVVTDRPPYNPYLYVKDTGEDVHLLGEMSLDGTYDPLMFMDENNFPWGLLVPADWIPPKETRRIEEFYPDFTSWRKSGGSDYRDWYLNYVDPDKQEANQPPYPVTGDDQTPFEAEETNPQYTARFSFEQYYYLFIEQVDGQDDPDGDAVTFASDPLPNYMSLDPDTGVLTIVDAPIGEETFSFWSVDSEGNDSSAESLTVTFQFIGS
jgi:LruC domain-containing protein